jgi:hypothetical protein
MGKNNKYFEAARGATESELKLLNRYKQTSEYMQIANINNDKLSNNKA